MAGFIPRAILAFLWNPLLGAPPFRKKGKGCGLGGKGKGSQGRGRRWGRRRKSFRELDCRALVRPRPRVTARWEAIG